MAQAGIDFAHINLQQVALTTRLFRLLQILLIFSMECHQSQNVIVISLTDITYFCGRYHSLCTNEKSLELMIVLRHSAILNSDLTASQKCPQQHGPVG